MQLNHRGINFSLFKEPLSQYWFYLFDFNWVVYRSRKGYKDSWQAIDAAEYHIDSVLLPLQPPLYSTQSKYDQGEN
jgi:hypothetical protein